MYQWTESLTKNELPNEELKLVADVFGLETTIKFMEELPGTLINIPKNGLNKCRNQYICQVYDGSKSSRIGLAIKFGVTERYIIQLVSKYRKRSDFN